MSKMRVWIDQNLCTGDGLCGEIEPAIFEGHDDGLYYVKETTWPSIYDDGTGKRSEPIYQMGTGLADVPEPNLQATIEAAEECPGECIFLEFE